MWDREIFLFLNFDGGVALDKVMLFASGHLSWIPLYLLILAIVWRRAGWRGMVILLLAIAAAVGLSDLFSGIFKHTGPLKHLLPDFPVRLRPMYTPEIEGMVHYINKGGQFGTISAHAATATSIGWIATRAIRDRWFVAIMWGQVALVSYSRIYLGYHFPQDILIGIAVGIASGALMWMVYKITMKRLG